MSCLSSDTSQMRQVVSQNLARFPVVGRFSKPTSAAWSGPKLSSLASTLGARARVARLPPTRFRSARMASTGPVASLSPASTWEVTISSQRISDEPAAGENLEIAILSKDNKLRTTFKIDGMQWVEKPTADENGLFKGWVRKGKVDLPVGFGTPGALLVTKQPASNSKAVAMDFLSSLKLKSEKGQEIVFQANTWICSDHGARVFFGGQYLPAETPASLLTERARDLQARQGTPEGPKSAHDRAFGYQIYDDMGHPKPMCGKDAPYPRHLANLRKKGETGPGKPWIPFDEGFDYGKTTGFKGQLATSAILAIRAALTDGRAFRSSFKSFDDVYGLYKDYGTAVVGAPIEEDLDESKIEKLIDLLHDEVEGLGLKNKAVKVVTLVKNALGKKGKEAEEEEPLTAAPGAKVLGGYVLDNIKEIKSISDNHGFKWAEPRVMKNRRDAWATDEEYGRQCLAGVNPLSIAALKKLPSEFGSAIKPEHVDAELKALGSPAGLEQLVKDAAAGKKPRVYIQDYWWMDAFWSRGTPDAKNRTQHAGRGLFFLQQTADGKDKALIPIVFELKHKKTHELDASLPKTSGWVYSRQELAHDPKKDALWMLAKAVFSSLDAYNHQLVSHWTRTHANTEPFLIALARQISIAHPVYKLMHPHFRYTIQMNADARQKLICAGALVDIGFTAAADAVPLSSPAYALWRFKDEALPVDLAKRGMVDANGKPWLDYPYATDGLDIWNAIVEYFSAYLKLYYKTDADVLADTEVQAWWDEIKNVGHQDLKFVEPDEAKVWGFAGPIPSVEKLTQVLATIAWIASGVHAAVNFAQYDYIGLCLNKPTLIQRPIPNPKDVSNPAYKALVEATGQSFWQRLKGSKIDDEKREDAQEKEFLTYISKPIVALVEMVTSRTLSIIDPDEHTLDMANHLIADPAAVALNQKFIERLKAAEKAMEARNKDSANFTRVEGHKESLPYMELMPSSPPGLTSRGVPYSVAV